MHTRYYGPYSFLECTFVNSLLHEIYLFSFVCRKSKIFIEKITITKIYLLTAKSESRVHLYINNFPFLEYCYWTGKANWRRLDIWECYLGICLNDYWKKDQEKVNRIGLCSSPAQKQATYCQGGFIYDRCCITLLNYWEKRHFTPSTEG